MVFTKLTLPILAVCLMHPGLRAQDAPPAVAAAGSTAPAPAEAAPEPPKPQAKAPLLDDGLLDPAWFGPGITLAKTPDDIDYAWIKAGLDIGGRTVRMAPWEEPRFLGKGRSRKDHAKGTEITDSFPGILRGAIAESLKDRTKVSRDQGDLVLVGRVVDARAGSRGAKWMIGMGAGKESATWDLKLVDARTGEVLVAVHHRVLSLTAMSDIHYKLVKWADRFADFLARKALPKEVPGA
jgi:hypothetical protein